MPTDSVKIIIERFQSFSLSSFLKPERFWIDGVIFGVGTNSLYLNSRFSWWSDLPEN